MHVTDLPDKTQDYLKTIWSMCEETGKPATLGAVASRLEQKNSTASEAIKRLSESGMVNHERYAGITLTERGQELALAMVRRHRLLETFLVTVLGYTWDEVHDEADILEHGITDRLLSRIDSYLGHPTKDPHGDPIPQEDGSLGEIVTENLNTVAAGETVTVERIADHDPELLRYLADHAIVPGAEIQVVSGPTAGLMMLQVGAETVPVAESGLNDIFISR
ncbi:metal-dependent transcriptional regulator [Corynebacterium poyangense]|uniref:Diphtheria toxin repressor n=1 Tax=Corynebacterium poyangense TaxID=2684405 RepID=A0A7H0SMC7_9CORY|nr:metal-dependent transcriptional regulator [Corynebacterium poyangense]MBZ8176803.1 metal-dependent transcriptional regulator [Corynebacterium poyangense]QNQ89702.1 metal-dependent transcriptional regulator [Corynebacterium poyangense]